MKQYIVKRGGVELTMQLSEEDAKRMNARSVPAKPVAPEADSPADEAEAKAQADAEAAAKAEAEAKAETEAKAAAEEKAKVPENKARAPQNK